MTVKRFIDDGIEKANNSNALRTYATILIWVILNIDLYRLKIVYILYI